jgi:transcription-repair coupling factor (superfamily II helicase)
MTLEHLLPLLDDLTLPDGSTDRWHTEGLSGFVRPAVIASLVSRLKKPVLVVVARQSTADQLGGALAAVLPPQVQPLIWTTPDPLPFEQLPHDIDLSARRIVAMEGLQRIPVGEPQVVIATARALIAQVRTPASFNRDSVTVTVGARIDDRRLVAKLVGGGYRRESLADEPGTLSQRGGILDVCVPGAAEGVRIEFFGDEVDSIRLFDPATQRSTERIGSTTLLPAIEFDLHAREEGIRRIRGLRLDQLRPEVHDEWRELVGRLEAGIVPESVDLLASLFPNNDATVLDYLPADAFLVLIDPRSIEFEIHQIALRAQEIRQTLEQAREIPRGLPNPFADWQTVAKRLEHFPIWEMGAGRETQTRDLPIGTRFIDPPLVGGRFDRLAQEINERLGSGWRVVLATDQSERVSDLLAERGLVSDQARIDGSVATSSITGTLSVHHAVLPGGFAYPDARLLVLTDREIFGVEKSARPYNPIPRRQTGQARAFGAGAYVVHVQHGVGIYRGLVTLETGGIEREYLHVDYAEGDRIYVPVDQSDRLVPWDAPAGEPRISKLSSTEWVRTKERVRQAVREMALELLQLYAVRALARGHAYPPDSAWDLELAESFPYRETEDQLKAITEVKADLERPQPMDRLVCGDVGFGKTEVALRAAFKVVNDGWQVAILVPTTVLALQHYETFRDRLAAYPVQVEMLSRLRGPREQANIVERLAAGEVDIVIGTHRIVQRDVRFKQLGLLVVDEEQRFGVRHKEHIKQLRAEIDVLTMTATPIPRTLHMALTGIRDLSLITTAPQERVPIRTFVTERDDSVVREAILREISRGGQVFVVHNRVQSIYHTAGWIRELVPEASVVVGHGQMEERELERVVLAFIQREYDVLVCTTIIESGVDIPNANTIIIDNAHALGLTQLYQLRGRVGRASNRAYAYLLYPKATPLSAEARARLEAIQEATDLGSGFQLAMRDMEIRGAGNVLGAEQSGHIAAVGLELYTTMLEQAVEEIRSGNVIVETDDVNLDIAVDARIPADYVPDEQVRLTIYQRIAASQTPRALDDMRAELVDRFGPIPRDVERIIELVHLRQRAAAVGVTSIIERDGVITLKPVVGPRLDQSAMRRLLGGGIRVSPNQVRLTVDHLSVGRLEAVGTILGILEEMRERVLVQVGGQVESSSTFSSS